MSGPLGTALLALVLVLPVATPVTPAPPLAPPLATPVRPAGTPPPPPQDCIVVTRTADGVVTTPCRGHQEG